MLNCVDVAFLPGGVLDRLPTPSQIGGTRTGGVNINKPRTRAALAAVLALAVSHHDATLNRTKIKHHAYGRNSGPGRPAQDTHSSRPRLRRSPHRHVDPVPRPRDQRRRLDNK